MLFITSTVSLAHRPLTHAMVERTWLKSGSPSVAAGVPAVIRAMSPRQPAYSSFCRNRRLPRSTPETRHSSRPGS